MLMQNYLPVITILSSLIGVVTLYFLVSIDEKSWINCFTPLIFTFIPSRYLLELIYLKFNYQSATDYGYLIIYTGYFFEVGGLIFGYLLLPTTDKISSNLNSTRCFLKLQYVSIIISIFLFLPILIEFKEFIFNPREIYTSTRSGYGGLYFGSLFFLNISIVFWLFNISAPKMSDVIFLSLALFIAYLHGSKSSLLQIIFISVIYARYINPELFQSHRSIILSAGFFVFIGIVFYLSHPSDDLTDFIFNTISYSDYTRNAMMVVDSPPPIQYGMLTLEDNIVSLIPRDLYPQKAKNFGSFYLSELFYPELFKLDQGTPSFGYGVLYADFREYALPITLMISLISGFFTKICVNKMLIGSGPWVFVLILFFSKVPVIDLGGVGILIPNLALSLILYLPAWLKILISSREKL